MNSILPNQITARMEFIRWLGSFVEDERGHTSSKRLALVMAATAYSIGIGSLMLAKAVYVLMHGGDCSLEIAAASFPLAAMAGVAYSQGKPSERSREVKDAQPVRPTE